LAPPAPKSPVGAAICTAAEVHYPALQRDASIVNGSLSLASLLRIIAEGGGRKYAKPEPKLAVLWKRWICWR
jgi:hypothetical protein